MIHIPVLLEKVIEYLAPKKNENFVDCTVGLGGHSFEILKRNGPKGKVLGIDKTEELIEKIKVKIKSLKMEKRFIVVCDNFINLKKIVKRYHFFPINGILFDLGMSSWHLEESKMGFSFKNDEALLMTFSKKEEITAKDILNNFSEIEIRQILKDFSQEKFAFQIARKIIEFRKKKKIETTTDLLEILKKATPKWYQKRKRHFATKTFQALRIAVNNELINLQKVLPLAFEVLEKGGRLIIISFHSLEDRIVKNFFKKMAIENRAKIITKKPIIPSIEEVKINPKSRSAKLRALIKL
ncbi:MAG: 16S rRNA (cytosine(1402)-N(4))-methyltransferase RsmH [Minisyncoccia bacterium]